MHAKLARTVLTLLIAVSITNARPILGQATPKQWSFADGGNGHWYQIFSAVPGGQEANLQFTGMTWNGQSGHLASLTSRAKNDFVASSLAIPLLLLPLYGFWIGAVQDRDVSILDRLLHDAHRLTHTAGSLRRLSSADTTPEPVD